MIETLEILLKAAMYAFMCIIIIILMVVAIVCTIKAIRDE